MALHLSKIKSLFSLTLLVVPVLYIGCTTQPGIRPVELTTEYLENPLGIDRTEPRLSWELVSEERAKSQSAYHIMVARSPEAFEQGEADLWDTGKITSTQNINIRYAGKPLKSRDMCYWKVKVWDEEGNASGWSDPAHWSMGLLSPKDWQAEWISSEYAPVSTDRSSFTNYEEGATVDISDSAAIYMRKEITLNQKPERVTVSLTGLGYYELYIDGEKVGDHVLDPVFTDYQKHVKYLTYDVTDALGEGEHALGVILGNGFYNLPTKDLFQMEKAHWKTPPKMILNMRLEYADGTEELVVSDSTWRWSTGAIVYNSIRGGETIDMRKANKDWNRPGYDDSGWSQVETVPAPVGELATQYMPPMRVTKSLEPVAMWEPGQGIYVFDFGENLTGWSAMKIRAEKNETVTLHFNEVLNPDSTLNIKHSSGHTWGRFQKGVFISDGEEAVFEPRYTYHGFRYVQVEGLSYRPVIGDIKAKSVHTDLQEAGTFSTSDERLNQLQAAVKRTLLNSVHSMPGEEPTREKMGWTFDAGMVTMEPYLFNFNAVTTYKKYLQDLIDAQEPNGHVPPIVPTNGWGFLDPDGTPVQYDDPWWGGTIVYVADKLYEFTGDTSFIAHAYEPMKKYVDFVRSTAENHLVRWSLGDWLDLKHNTDGWGPGLTPVVQTSTAAYYYLSNILAQHAALLGNTEDAQIYSGLAKTIKKTFNESFLDRETGWYREGSQTAQALPLYLGMVPEESVEKVEARLLEAIEANNGHISTGFVGVVPLLHYLSSNGHHDVAYRLVTNEESPGWMHMVEDVKSTLGENLNGQGYGTGHHPFGTNVGFWLYRYLGGIQPDDSAPGFVRFTIRPQIVEQLDWVKSSYKSLKGTIVNNWYKDNSRIRYEVHVPVNSEAELWLRATDTGQIKESGVSISKAKGVMEAEQVDEHVKLRIGSGKYEFEVRSDK